MSNQFLKLRRSSVPGKVPTTSSLEFGEIALNTYDGLAFIKKSGSNGEEVIPIGFSSSFAASASYALTASYALNSSGISISGSQYFIPVFSGSTIVESTIYQSASFIAFPNVTEPYNATYPDLLFISASGIDTYNLVSAHSDRDGYVQLNVQNFSLGSYASSDVVASANNATENSYYIDMGINGENYSNTALVGSQNDAYMYSTGHDLLIGNASAGRRVVIFNGGLDALATAKVFIHDQGTVSINTSTYNIVNPPALQVQATSLTTFNVANFQGNTDNFLQLTNANLSTGTNASADIVAYNNIDPVNESAGFVDMGINSTNYVYNGIYPGSAGDAYLFTDSHHLVLGATSASGATKVTLFAGGISEADNAKLTLYGNNQHQMTGSLSATEGFTGSLFGTASWARNTLTASFVATSSWATNSLTASSADNFVVRGNLTGSNALFTGTITAQTLNVQYVTASTEFITGSSKFGSLLTDTHQFTGSVSITSSLTVNGSLFATSSWARNALTASYVPSTAVVGDFSRIATGSVTASVGIGTASFQLTSGSSTFLFVSNSGNVGIGTNVPFSGSSGGAGLELVGTTGRYGVMINRVQNTNRSAWLVHNGSGGGELYMFNNGNANTIYLNGAGASFINTSANLSIGSGVDSGHRLLISGSGASGSLNVDNTLFVSGSRTGVGIAFPSASLHISGSTGILLEVDSNLRNNILYVTSSGFVGINTGTPSASLDVSGSFIVNTPASSYDFVVTGSVSGSIVRVGTDQQALQGGLHIPKLYVKPNYAQNRAGIQVSSNTAGTVAAAMYSGYGAESEGLQHGIRLQYLQTSTANDQNGTYFAVATDSRYGYYAFNGIVTTGNTNSGSNGFASNLYFQNQGGASLTGSGAYVGYKSIVQFATSPILVNTASDFLADTVRNLNNGTLTNRYGLHITFTSQSITNPWGVYQVSDTINNHFNGGVYIGTTTTSSLKLDVSGSGRFTSGLTVTGSLIAPNITGSLLGTSSWANNAITASYVTASNVFGPFGSNSVISSSFALTASHVIGGASTIAIQDEGSPQGSAGTINFTGAGVIASVAGGIATVNIPGAGGTTFPYTGSAIISGSLIVTGSVSATQGGFTGSLLGTASWAQNAVTASYVTGSVFTSTNPALTASFALTASYALNAGTSTAAVTNQITSGSVTASVNIGTASFQLTSGSSTFLFVSNSGNVGIGTATPVSPLHVSASGTTIATFTSTTQQSPQINIVGTDRSATIGTAQRAVGIQVVGIDIGRNSSTQIDASNVIRYLNGNGTVVYGYVGQLSTTQFGITSNSDLHLQTNQTSSIYIASASGFVAVGRNYTAPSFSLDVSGSGRYTRDVQITGSLNAPIITGSLFGTSSWAQNVLTASYVTGSIHNSANPALSASYALSSSFAVSALTASYVLGGSSTINIQDEGSPQGSAGTINFVGPGVTATVSAGTATVTINPTGSTALHTQASPAVTWSFNHNLGNLYPVLNVWDSNGFMIMPGGVKTVNANSIEIYFDLAQAGYASAVVGGTAVSASYALTASYALNGGSGPAAATDFIASGIVTASVAASSDGIFLIKSGSVSMFEVSGSGRFTANSSLFIIKNYTTQQPVFTVSESIVKFATQSAPPTGNPDPGALWVTATDLYIGLN